MSAYEIISSYACKFNWSKDQKLAALIQYIENQQNNDALEDFLSQFEVEPERTAQLNYERETDNRNHKSGCQQ